LKKKTIIKLHFLVRNVNVFLLRIQKIYDVISIDIKGHLCLAYGRILIFGKLFVRKFEQFSLNKSLVQIWILDKNVWNLKIRPQLKKLLKLKNWANLSYLLSWNSENFKLWPILNFGQFSTLANYKLWRIPNFGQFETLANLKHWPIWNFSQFGTLANFKLWPISNSWQFQTLANLTVWPI